MVVFRHPAAPLTAFAASNRPTRWEKRMTQTTTRWICMAALTFALGAASAFAKADEKGILIAAESAKGLLYGTATLRQMIVSRGLGTPLPAVNVRDWPKMKLR